MVERIAGWWDGFELWVAGLPFIPQFLVVLVIMVPISFVIAFALDRALHAVMRVLGRDRGGSAPDGADQAEVGVAPVAEPIAPTVVDSVSALDASAGPVRSGVR